MTKSTFRHQKEESSSSESSSSSTSASSSESSSSESASSNHSLESSETFDDKNSKGGMQMQIGIIPLKEGEKDEKLVYLNNVKVAASSRNYMLASFAISHWLRCSSPETTLADLEILLREKDIPLWLQVDPQRGTWQAADPQSGLSSGDRSKNAIGRYVGDFVPSPHLKYMCLCTVGTSEFAASLLKERNLDYSQNLALLKEAGFMFSTNNIGTKINESSDAFLVSHGKVWLTLQQVSLESVLEQDCHEAQAQGMVLETRLIGMTKEGYGVMSFIDKNTKSRISKVALVTGYNKNGEKVLDYIIT